MVEVLEGVVVDIVESEDTVEDHQVAEVDIVVVHHLQVLEVVATKEAHRLDHLEVEDMVGDRARVEKVDTKEVEGVVQEGVIKKMHLHHDQLHEDIATIEIAMDDHQVSNKKEAKASFFVIVRGIY